MSHHPSRYTGPDLPGHIRSVLESTLPEARAEVAGGGGHFTISVVSPVFRGKSLLEQQRMVLNALGELLRGEDAPIHAVDKLTTKAS